MPRAVALALALVLLSGCRSVDTSDELGATLSPGAVVLSVPSVRQTEKEGCGLACLVALLHFHGLDLDAEARARFSEERLARSPITAGELRDYLRGRGLQAYLVHGSLDERYPQGLFGVVRSGLPVIIELATEKRHHYGLVCGFDPGRRLVVVMDPETGFVGVPEVELERHWASADHLMLVAASRGT
jgi:ABC-type bacteriocin/lantibiotic exporter with double-glycine peptidase domain